MVATLKEMVAEWSLEKLKGRQYHLLRKRSVSYDYIMGA